MELIKLKLKINSNEARYNFLVQVIKVVDPRAESHSDMILSYYTYVYLYVRIISSIMAS